MSALVAKKQVQALQQEMLDTLASLGGRAVSEDEIAYGPNFQLPEIYRDNPRGAIDYLVKWVESNEEPHRFVKNFPYKPWDGAVAVQRAFRSKFGVVALQQNTFFDKATDVSIPISATEEMRVPYGKITVPIFRGTLRIQGTSDDDGYETFTLIIDTARKWQYQVEGIFALVQEQLERDSIYRGKAIDGADMPIFLDLERIDASKIIYSQLTLRQLEANLWSPIKHPEICRERGLDPKRAVLLQGPYGTGKTLAAMATAKICDAVGRTFIMCNPRDNNAFECLKTAALYEPACVFIEDIDKLTDTDDKNAMARLLDEFDGFKAKNKDIMIVLTTNKIGEIHRGMLRPGRMDAVIHIGELDLEGLVKLISTQFKETELDESIDYDAVFLAMHDFTPAFMKEVCQKVKLYSIERIANGSDEVYTTEDFLAACQEMRVHYNLHADAADIRKTPTIDQAFQSTFKKEVLNVLDELPISGDGLDLAIDISSKLDVEVAK